MLFRRAVKKYTGLSLGQVFLLGGLKDPMGIRRGKNPSCLFAFQTAIMRLSVRKKNKIIKINWHTFPPEESRRMLKIVKRNFTFA